eukprot:1587900-Prymnesium_polylepis.1
MPTLVADRGHVMWATFGVAGRTCPQPAELSVLVVEAWEWRLNAYRCAPPPPRTGAPHAHVCVKGERGGGHMGSTVAGGQALLFVG